MSDNSLTPPKSIRARSSQRSIIRELLKLASQPDVISFAGGLPSPKSFPVKAIEKATDWVLETQGTRALQYSSTEGEPALRKAIAAHEAELGAPVDPDCIQIVSGSQQALDLMALAYIDEGSKVAVEDPTYLGALSAFKLQRPEFVTLPTDEHGLNPDLIGPEFSGIRFAYVMPTFQNPTGITITEERRKKLAEKAREYDFWILEDNPYGDLYYEGEPLPSIKSFDTDGIVLYAGSFSKVISPGMRVGYAIGPKPVLAKMTVCKQGQDVHTNIWSQVLCYRFMTEYDFDAHLAGLRKIYTKKRALLLDLMEKHLAPYITWDPFNGGLFAWCHLPKGVDMMEFVQKALEKKVCVVPGTAFLTDENEPCDAFRINFSTPTDEQLTKGITLLGETIREMVEK